jgi:HEAT repeat protein
LFVDFGDSRGFKLLLEAARGDDKPRWRQALDAIGNQANFGKRAPAELATALKPVLKSKDADRRYAAVNALGVFADESVWPALVSALGDDDAQVAAAARRHLQSQPDREGIMRRLADAARTFPSPMVRDAAHALLQDLAREE